MRALRRPAAHAAGDPPQRRGLRRTRDGIPVRAVLADSHAALYAHGAAKATYGTGSSVMVPSAHAGRRPRAHARVAHRRAASTPSRATSSPAAPRSTGWRARSASSGSSRSRAADTRRRPPRARVQRPRRAALGPPGRRAAQRAHARRHAASTSRAPRSSRSRTRSATSSTCVELDVLHADGGATASDLLMQCQADLVRPARCARAPRRRCRRSAPPTSPPASAARARPATFDPAPVRGRARTPPRGLARGGPAFARGDPPAGGDPAMTPTPLLRLMTKVARLYYEQGLRQAEIADRLDLSQSRVSRLLKQAEKEGIVRITVAVPQGFHAELEDRLQVLYGLREAVVVDCERDDDQEALRAIGAAGRRVPGDDADRRRDPRHLELERVAAVDARQHAPAGRSPARRRSCRSSAASGNPAAEGHATRLTSRLAQLVGGEARFLPAPGVVGSRASRRALLDDPFVAAAMRWMEEITLAIVGIGALTPSKLLAAERQRVHRRGAAGARGARRGRRHLPALLRRRRRAGGVAAGRAGDRARPRADQAPAAHARAGRRPAQVRGDPGRAARALRQRADHRSLHRRAPRRRLERRARTEATA